MKKKLIIFCGISIFFIQAKENLYINKLNWVEISKERLAPQIMMDFAKPLYFEKKADRNKMTLEFAFPNMNIKDFEQHNILQSLQELQAIKKVELLQRKNPSPRVVLIITFNSDDFLVRWYKMEDPNRLVLDIFSKRSLAKFRQKGSMILYAQNDFIKSDIKKIQKKKYHNCVINSQKPSLFYNNNKKFTVIIDAGHGGDDSGAKGFFALKEKDVSLDIAKRVSELLKKKGGFKAFLTRTADKNLSLFDRCELSGQLRADLFVSIHVNAVQSVESISGIETYYLNDETLLTPKRRGGYLFCFSQNDKNLANIADSFIRNNANLSKSLANSIQKNILSFLQEHRIFPRNRGTKGARFRILLKSEIPVALIEVGFLTNKKEAKLLANEAYRNIIAQGIVQGIEEYICSYQ
ncbi:hypothetical protein GF322_02450 [Candidatus Dependentiae bacterium]|nr:hypothetical protein [Candidatus Dependentiae bacterium]